MRDFDFSRKALTSAWCSGVSNEWYSAASAYSSTPVMARLTIEIPDATAEAIGRMALTLGSTPKEVAERILTAAATAGVEAAIKAVNTKTWRQPRRKQ